LRAVEYAGSIGDAKNRESQTREQERILELVDRFWRFYGHCNCECDHTWTMACLGFLVPLEFVVGRWV